MVYPPPSIPKLAAPGIWHCEYGESTQKMVRKKVQTVFFTACKRSIRCHHTRRTFFLGGGDGNTCDPFKKILPPQYPRGKNPPPSLSKKTIPASQETSWNGGVVILFKKTTISPDANGAIQSTRISTPARCKARFACFVRSQCVLFRDPVSRAVGTSHSVFRWFHYFLGFFHQLVSLQISPSSWFPV